MTQIAPATVSQIATALGITPQAVRRTLRGVKPDSVLTVKGKEAATWTLDSLPPPLRCRLNVEARLRGYRDAGHLLAAPPKRWELPEPINQFAQHEIDKATKSREAFRTSLLRQHDSDLTAAEFEAQGLADYAKAFGHTITARHWRSLFKRTLQRDAGAEDWERLEIYLSDKPALKKSPELPLPESWREDFQGLSGLIGTFPNPAALTLAERRAVWALSIGRHDEFIRQGMSPKQAGRRVRAFLFARLPSLASNSRDALRVAFERKLARVKANGGHPNALADGRQDRGDQVEIPESDLRCLVASAAFENGGRVDAAWREKYPHLSEQMRSHYSHSPRAPRKIHQLLNRAEVDIMADRHQGKRTVRRKIGGVKCHTSGMSAMHAWSVDDMTSVIEISIINPDGSTSLILQQIIAVMDIASRKWVGWAISDDKAPTAELVCAGVLDGFRKHGVPKQLGFENGFVFGKSLNVNGKEDEQGRTIVAGLAQYGCAINRFEPMNPQSKGELEKSFDLIQRRMERHPGYTGRDQRFDAPEAFKLERRLILSGKVPAAKHRYTFEQGISVIENIIHEYNSTPQYGELKGLSPNEAFAALKNLSDPPIEFAPELGWLLANERYRVTVAIGGVRFQHYGRTIRVRGAELVKFLGKELWALVDRRDDSMVTFMDLNFGNPFTMEVCQSPSKRESTIAPGSGIVASERAKIREVEREVDEDYKGRLNEFGNPRKELLRKAQNQSHEAASQDIARTTMIPFRMAESAEQMREQREQLNDQKTEKQSRGDVIRRRAQKLGLRADLVENSDQNRDALNLMVEARREGEIQRADSVIPQSAQENLPTEDAPILPELLDAKAKPANDPIPGKSLKKENGKFIYDLKPSGGDKARYVDHLIERLTEFRKAGEKRGQHFRGEISFGVTKKIAQSQLKGNLHDESRFDEICEYLKAKIDATRLGKRNVVQGSPNYCEFSQAQEAL
jgi:hypothetical protein